MSNYIVLESLVDKTLHFLKEIKVISHDDEIEVGNIVTFQDDEKFVQGKVLNFSGWCFLNLKKNFFSISCTDVT